MGLKRFLIGAEKNQLITWALNPDELFEDLHLYLDRFEDEIQFIQLRYLLSTHNFLKDLTSKDYSHSELIEFVTELVNRYEKAGFSPLTFSFFISVFLNAFDYSEPITEWINPLVHNFPKKPGESLNQLGFGTNIETLEDYEIDEGVLHSYTGDKTIVYIPPSVTQIAEYAFEGKDFKAIIIPKSVQSLGKYTFKNCSNLEIIKCEQPITDIPEGLFYGCKSLKHYDYLSEIDSLGHDAFKQTGMNVLDDSSFKNAEIALEFISQLDKLESLTIDSLNLFDLNLENIKVEKLTLGSSVTEIVPNAIKNSSIETLIMKAQDIEIHSNAFFGSTISNLDINDSKYQIINDVFLVNENKLLLVLKNDYSTLEIPTNITHILAGSINKHEKLEKIRLGENIVNIQTNTLNNCHTLKSLEISMSTLDAFEKGFNGDSNISNIKLNHQIDNLIADVFPNIESVNLGKDFHTIRTLQFSSLKNLISIQSDYVETIDDFAFHDCVSLERIEIIHSNYIGFGAFSNCDSLNYLCISTPLENFKDSISPKTFGSLFNVEPRSGFQKLTVTFKEQTSKDYFVPSTLNSVEIKGDNIPEYFYQGVKNVGLAFEDPLKYIERSALHRTDIKEITLSDEAVIAENAFAECSQLRLIHNLNNVSSIDTSALNNCESLQDISIENATFDVQIDVLNSLISLEKIKINHPLNPDHHVSDNIIFDTNKHEIIFIPPLFKPQEITLSNLKQINRNIMSHFSEIKTVEIDYVERIDDFAFQDLKDLEILDLGNHIEEIGNQIINDNQCLKKLNLPFLGPKPDIGIEGNFTDYYSSQPLTNLQFVSIRNGLIKNTIFNELINLISFEYFGHDQSVCTNAFSNLSSLKNIHFQSKLTDIGDYAFYKCLNLDIKSLVKTALVIGESSFEECRNISEIEIHESATIVGRKAFKNIQGLRKITVISDNVDLNEDCFNTAEHFDYVNLPIRSKAIEDFFGNNPQIEHLKIRTNSLQSHFMTDNQYLKKLTLHGAIEKIPENAFSNCTNLKTVSLNEHVKSIGFSAFENCVNLKTLHGTDGIEFIYDDAFKNCTYLSDISITNIKEIGKYAFTNCTELSMVQVGESLEKIDDFAFSNDHSLNYVSGGINLNYLGRGVFQNCDKLSHFNLGKVRELFTETFDNCKSIEQLSIPYTCRSIGTKVFDSCSSLKQIKIPISVDYIDEFAFYHSYNMMVIVVDDKKQTKSYHKYWNYIHDEILEIKNPLKKIKLNFSDRFRVVGQLAKKEYTK